MLPEVVIALIAIRYTNFPFLFRNKSYDYFGHESPLAVAVLVPSAEEQGIFNGGLVLQALTRSNSGNAFGFSPIAMPVLIVDLGISLPDQIKP